MPGNRTHFGDEDEEISVSDEFSLNEKIDDVNNNSGASDMSSEGTAAVRYVTEENVAFTVPVLFAVHINLIVCLDRFYFFYVFPIVLSLSHLTVDVTKIFTLGLAWITWECFQSEDLWTS